MSWKLVKTQESKQTNKKKTNKQIIKKKKKKKKKWLYSGPSDEIILRQALEDGYS